jgi:outer membrane protein
MATAFALTAPATTRGGEAGSSSAQEPLRIGYVDLDRVAANSAMVKQRIDTVQQNLVAKQEKFQTMATELRELRRRLQQQASVLTAAQEENLKAQIRRLRDDMDKIEYDANKILSRTGRDVIEPVLDEVLAAVERVATAYKIDLVLRGDLVLYSSKRVDLTDAVVRELDRGARKSSNPSPAKPPARRSDAPGGGSRATTPKSDNEKTPRLEP